MTGSSNFSACLSGDSTFLPRISSTISCSVRERMFSSPSSGNTADMYSEKALPGERIWMRRASSVSRWRYMRKAARCMAMDVLPEPAPPTTEITRAFSCRMAADCSAWMVETTWRMWRVVARESRSSSISSSMLNCVST